MVEDFSDSFFRQVDPGKEYLWDWSPASGKSGGILSGMNLDRCHTLKFQILECD
jgi:hypothetical protein